MYGVSLIGLHKNKDDQFVLSPSPHWPAILNLHNALFDTIQCHEACVAFFGVKDISSYDELSRLWYELARIMHHAERFHTSDWRRAGR